MTFDLMNSIHELLVTSGTLNDEFGGRFSPTSENERAKTPYLVFSDNGGSDSWMFPQGSSPRPQSIGRILIQFDIWADAKTKSGSNKSPRETYRLTELLRSFLNDVPISHPSWGGMSVGPEGRPQVLRDGDFWHGIMIYAFEAHELSPA